MIVRHDQFRIQPPRLLPFGVLITTLMGIIAFELYDILLIEAPGPVAAPTPAASARQQSEGSPTSSLSERSRGEGDQYMAIILARPLFSPSRRPDAVAKGDTATDLARLTGVLVSPAEKSAIFAGPGGSKSIVVREGAHVGKYVVSSIDAGGVTVIGPAGQRVLHPAFDPSPPPPKPVTPAPITTSIVLGQGPTTPTAKLLSTK